MKWQSNMLLTWHLDNSLAIANSAAQITDSLHGIALAI